MAHNFLNILKVVVFIIPLAGFHAQVVTGIDSVNSFAQKKHDLNKKGMIILTTWASANILSGAACFITGAPEEKYFYAMNSAWGAVNLAIAVPALLSKKKSYSSKQKLMEDQLKTEKVFLINAILDLFYIGGGFALKEVSKGQTDMSHKALFTGFGNSFIIQGAGLLVFDVSMYTANKHHRRKYLSKIMDNTQISMHSNSIKLKFQF